MIPSRGLRWSGQVIGIGRRHLETFSARQFSSVQNASAKPRPLLWNSPVSTPNTNPRSQFSRTNTFTRNGFGLRFASTSPATIATTANTTDPTNAVGSVATSTPNFTTSSLDDAIDFTSDSLYTMPEHIGYLKSLGLDYGWGPTSAVEWLLEHVHIFAGTPWWVSITLTAIIVRVALFKPYIDAAENGAKMNAIKHITQPLTTQMSAAFRAGDNTTATQLRMEIKMINQRAGIKLWKAFVPAIQMFTGYGTFVLLRAMAYLPVPGFEDGGVLWFHNLALPDPFIILPVATASLLHLVLRRGGETGATNMSPEAMKLMMYGLPAITLLFTWWLPAALQLSFFVSGLLSFGQASLFKLPWFRNYMNMTPLPTGPVAASNGRPPSPYKGTMKVRAPMSTEKLNSAFQEVRKQSLIEKAKKQMMDNTKEIRTAAGTMMNKSQFSLKGRQEKSDKKVRDEYEKKRKQEIQAEMEEKRKEILEARRRKKQALQEK